MGATVLYPCDRPLYGHVVSINKTSPTEAYLQFLVMHEVEVFGFEDGEDFNYHSKCDWTDDIYEVS